MNELQGCRDQDQDLSCSSAPSTHRKPCRILLDAVEIVNKTSYNQMPPWEAGSHSTKIVASSASSHYSSPPTNYSYSDVALPHNTRPLTTTNPGSNVTSCLKTSKYFDQTSPLCSIPRNLAGSTPISPIQACFKDPNIKSPPTYPPSVGNFYDTPAQPSTQHALDESTRTSTWCNSPGLYDDLMLMLKRLKPILIQETVRDDPWKLLIAVRLLNVTSGTAAIPVFCKVISRWPTPQDLMQAPHNELVELLRPLGLHNKRAKWLSDMSTWFHSGTRSLGDSSVPLASLLFDDRITATALRKCCPAIGSYAIDSLRIFCARDGNAWKGVVPRDKELVRYLRWRWAFEEGKVWYHDGVGVIGNVNVPYLITLVDELAAHYDRTIGGNGYMYHFCNDVCGAMSDDKDRGV